MDPTSQIKLAPTVPLTPEQIAAAQPPPEDIAKLERRATDAAVAASAPLPGPLRDAFAADSPEFLGLPLYPVTATHIACLTRLKNPFLDGLRYGMAGASAIDKNEKSRLLDLAEKLNITPEDIFEALFVFAQTPQSIRSMQSAPPTQSIRDQSTALMDSFAPIAPDQLSSRLAEHYFDSFKTAVNYQASDGGREELKKKLSPLTSATTALAGS